jgi:transcriptional regulator with XRE-family HTH domain
MVRGRKKKVVSTDEDTGLNSNLCAESAQESESGIGPIDVHVGSRIYARRRLLQLSQKEMAERLGITFQQVQKYEKGVNRIGAGRLYSIATILGVDIDYFYGDVESDSFTMTPEYGNVSGAGFLAEDQVEQKFDPMYGTEATMLLKAFYSLPVKARTALLTMLTSLRDRDEASNEK